VLLTCSENFRQFTFKPNLCNINQHPALLLNSVLARKLTIIWVVALKCCLMNNSKWRYIIPLTCYNLLQTWLNSYCHRKQTQVSNCEVPVTHTFRSCQCHHKSYITSKKFQDTVTANRKNYNVHKSYITSTKFQHTATANRKNYNVKGHLHVHTTLNLLLLSWAPQVSWYILVYEGFL